VSAAVEYSIRPVDQKTPHSIAPRRKRGEEREPFDLARDGGQRPASEAYSGPEQPGLARAIAPPAEDDVGAHLDLSA